MPGKGKKHPGGAKGSKEHGDKKTTGASKPTDKKAPEATEKKASASGVSQPVGAHASGTSKLQPSQERTMKPADPKAKQIPKTEPAKTVQSTKPKSTSTSTTPSSSTAAAASKPSTAKVPSKQEPKPVPAKDKTESKVTSGTSGKVAAAAAAAGTVAAGAAVGVAVAASGKPKEEVKEEQKTVSVDKVSSAAAPAKTGLDDALDELIDTLGGPEDVQESPKFTGPEVTEIPAISEYLEELGKREHTIPPEYRHLLDGKGEKPAPPPKEDDKSMGDDDLVEALSSGFVSSQAPPEEKKPKLEKNVAIKPTSATAVATAPSSESVPADAIDELLGTLEGPEVNVPQSPEYTGPEVTEIVTASYLEELGKRDHTIPPEYRNLLDGKDHGKDIPPPVPAKQPPPMTDTELADEFSKDFGCSSAPVVEPEPSIKPKEAKHQQSQPDKVVATSASSVQSAAAAPSGEMDSALDELMGTLEGPEFNVPEPPVYTGPEVTETATASYIEELGKRESSIPPEYRHLLDGKEDGKIAPPPPPAEKPMSEDDLAAAFDEDFACPQPTTVQQTPSSKPKDSSSEKSKNETVVSSSSSAVQSAPVLSKPSAPKVDPLDALSGTLGVRQEDPKTKKPVADAVKEKSDKGKKEKLGEDEETIPPDYRLQEVRDKDGKPLLPKAEEKPKAMTEDELLDALTEDFVTSPATTPKTAPLQSSAKEATKPSVSDEVVSSSKVSTVQSGAPQPSDPDIKIPDDALDLLSGSLGSREADPDENKPLVDVVKEKAKSEHVDRLGDRDDTIPPEYRNLLDGKDEKGQPIKPPAKEDVKPKDPLDDNAAIDALSSGFASCDTKQAETPQQSSKDKTEKSSPSTAVSQSSGKTPDPPKDKNKSSSSTAPAQSTVSDPAKTPNQISSKPSNQKTGKS
ncbi:calpastatin [Spea bombifrons]|uniref:calpastatin n=1 Tax=Spea bombifrons TaxID=233779 RepID=UPI002349CCE8|nr:calpastatin [Spea bombifrons]